MYPKPQQARASSNHSTTRNNKREQLTDLLVNKFRNKYAINLQQEQDLDLKLKNEVIKCVQQTHALQEKDLNELD